MLSTLRQVFFALKGHTLIGCMRLTMYSAMGIPFQRGLYRKWECSGLSDLKSLPPNA